MMERGVADRKKYKGYLIKVEFDEEFFTYTIFNKEDILVHKDSGFISLSYAISDAQYAVDNIIYNEGIE